MTKEVIAELSRLEAAATPGNWVYSPERHTHDSPIHQDLPVDANGYYYEDTGGIVGSSEWIWLTDANAELIVAARNALPDLLNEIQGLRKDISRLRRDTSRIILEAEQTRDPDKSTVSVLFTEELLCALKAIVAAEGEAEL